MVRMYPYPQSENTYILRSEGPWKYHLIAWGQYDSFMKILADKKGKTADKLTREEQAKNKEHMPVSKINKSTPDETHQTNLIADLRKEEYLEFEGMCG